MEFDWGHPIVVTIIGIGCSGVLGLCVYLVRSVNDVKGILIGPDGEDGVRGDVRELVVERKAQMLAYQKNREEDIRARAITDTEIDRLQEDHRGLAKRVAVLEMSRTLGRTSDSP